eukprot:2302978-Amphidinium_carterae.2
MVASSPSCTKKTGLGTALHRECPQQKYQEKAGVDTAQHGWRQSLPPGQFHLIAEHQVKPCDILWTSRLSSKWLQCDSGSARDRLQSVDVPKGAKAKQALSEEQVTDLRRAVGSLSWLVRGCRPDFLAHVALLAQMVSKPVIRDLQRATSIIYQLQRTKDVVLFYPSNGGLALSVSSTTDITQMASGVWACVVDVPITSTKRCCKRLRGCVKAFWLARRTVFWRR